MEDIDLNAFDERNKKNYYYCICNGITSAEALAAACNLSSLHAENVIDSMKRNKYIKEVINITERQFTERFGSIDDCVAISNKTDEDYFKLALHALIISGEVRTIHLQRNLKWGYVRCVNAIDLIRERGYTEYKTAITPEEFVRKNGDPDSFYDPEKLPKFKIEDIPLPERTYTVPIKIIGLGGVGLATVARLTADTYYKGVCCAISDKQEKLQGYENSYLVKSPVPEVGEVADAGLNEYVTKFVGDTEFVIITTCSCGCAIAAPVAKALIKQGKTCMVIATQPHTPKAPAQTELVRKCGAAVTVFDKPDDEPKAQAVEKHFGIIENLAALVLKPTLINLDLEDVMIVLRNKTEFAYSEFKVTAGKISEEYEKATSGHKDILKSATNSIVNINGGADMKLSDINEIIECIREDNGSMNIIFGADVRDAAPADSYTVSIMATK